MKFKFIKHNLYLACTVVGVLALQSCARETLIGTRNNSLAEVSFLAHLPQVGAVATRATVAENKVDDIYVLVFDVTADTLVYKGTARDLTPSGATNETIDFKATLPIDKSYDFIVLANAASLLSEISVGQAVAKSDVEALIVSYTEANSVDSKWSTTVGIPMWGELTGVKLTSSTQVTFYLTRMLARINVAYVPVEGAADNFRITAVRYYNYNTAGMLIPATANISGADSVRRATATTLPTAPGTQLGLSLEYTGTENITDSTKCIEKIYVFEANNVGKYGDANDVWIDNPCLVVGGKYDSDADQDYNEEPEVWYRIDFIRKDQTTGDVWLSLLRNFSYNVTITSVSGDGYSDPDIALNSVPMNMEAGVIDWNDAQMGDVTADGPSWLSVGNSRNEGLRKAASLYRNATSTDEIEFSTNIPLDLFTMEITYDGATDTFTQEDPTMAEAAAGMVAKISDTFYQVALMQGQTSGDVYYGKFVFTALNDYAASNPISTLTVSSGRIRYVISISQKDADPQDWNDGGNKNEELQ
jgi:hypothetical protein